MSTTTAKKKKPAAGDGPRPYESASHFWRAVAATARGGPMDPRLYAAAGMNEADPTAGGFLVPRTVAETVFAGPLADSLAGRCRSAETDTFDFRVPCERKTPWEDGALSAYWVAEAADKTTSTPPLGLDAVPLGKLAVLVPASEELVEDAAALPVYLNDAAPRAVAWALDLAVLRGTGAGRPLGVLNAGCRVTVAKESGQSAATVVTANVNNMWSRLLAGCQANAAWVCHPDLLPQLSAVSAANAYSFPFGRPVVPHEGCSAPGSEGDLVLADFSQYLLVTRRPGLRKDVSIHVRYVQGEQHFRFVLRVGGQPWQTSAVTSRVGGVTRSAFVTLADRS